MINFKSLMRKSYALYLIISIILITSCTNSGDSKLSYTDVDTIKEVVKEREAQVSWTRELEGSRLAEPLESDTELYDKVVIFNHQLAKINKEKIQPVYPEYPDFGSLDTRLLSVNAKETINNFCNAVSTDFYRKPQTYFDNQYIFNLVFFRNDFIDGWKANFKKEFPIENPLKKKETSKKENEDEEKEPDPIFTKYLLGEPFLGTEITQVPVRFYCKHGIVDVTLYLNKKNLINQVSINRWEKI